MSFLISAGCRVRWILSPPSPTGFRHVIILAGVALAYGSLNPCLCYFAPAGLKILFAYTANSEIAAANAATV